MSRHLAIALGVLVILAGGLVHGRWTDRWHRSAELELAVARMQNLPDDLGPWHGRAEEQDPEALLMAGAGGHWSRRFTNANTGDEVLVILLCGRPGQMSVHRPEHCYVSAGYEMSNSPTQYSLPFRQGEKGNEGTAEFWTAMFRKDEAKGPVQLRIFWSWMGSSGWLAPGNPRWTFARESALYKLYVLRVNNGAVHLADDPAVGFLGQLIPELNRHLVP